MEILLHLFSLLLKSFLVIILHYLNFFHLHFYKVIFLAIRTSFALAQWFIEFLLFYPPFFVSFPEISNQYELIYLPITSFSFPFSIDLSIFQVFITDSLLDVNFHNAIWVLAPIFQAISVVYWADWLYLFIVKLFILSYYLPFPTFF